MIEAAGNASTVANILASFVDRVLIANPKQVRTIAHAKSKTDAIGAAVLAKLYRFPAGGLGPDQRIPALRRQVARRTQLVRQRVRLKNLIQSILHALDLVEGPLKVVEAEIARETMADPVICRLMTLAWCRHDRRHRGRGSDRRRPALADPRKLVGCLGLNPSVRQSGEGPAYHGRITKQGRGQARGMLVEAA